MARAERPARGSRPCDVEVGRDGRKGVGRRFPRLLPQSQPVSTGQTFFDIWRAPYGKRTSMMIIFNVCQTVGFYGFANWVPTLLVKQGITLTTSLLYSSIIAISAPVGPLIGLVIGDKFERKSVIVATAAAIVVCGLAFSQVSSGMLLIAMGVGLTLASNIMSYSFHAYQTELFPTSIRSSAVGFVYSWSRFSAIFTSFLIAGVLKKIRHDWRVRFHCGGDADRDGGDWLDGAAHAESCVGRDFAMTGDGSRSEFYDGCLLRDPHNL